MLTGFRNFILRGNLVEVAVALVMALAFTAVVTAFTAWLTATIQPDGSTYFSGDIGTFGFFLNAVFTFVILAAVVYFLVVVPYTHAKERFFPAEEPGTPDDIALLQEIRDLLAQRSPGT